MIVGRCRRKDTSHCCIDFVHDFRVQTHRRIISFGYCHGIFRRRTTSASDDTNNKAEYIFNAARKIKLVIPEVTSVAYLRSLYFCISNPEFNLNQFVKKATTYPDQHRKSNTISVIISNIEHIYNFRNQGKTRIILQK